VGGAEDGRRKKEEGRRKKEEGRRKKEDEGGQWPPFFTAPV
jgi:hypothetical protein